MTKGEDAPNRLLRLWKLAASVLVPLGVTVLAGVVAIAALGGPEGVLGIVTGEGSLVEVIIVLVIMVLIWIAARSILTPLLSPRRATRR